MRLGLDVAQHHLEWPEILARVRLAEEAGFDGAWVFDHFRPLYGSPVGPTLEAWTLLAGLAASTQRIRLGALVTGITYRSPSLLAAEAVTVDHLSAGRLELAVGAAWFEEEHRQLGFDFPPPAERARRLEEAVTVLRLLMSGQEATYHGRHHRLERATYRPVPVQRPHPPIWIGASGERLMLPLVGRVADAWHSFGSVEALRRRAAILDRHAEAAGRDPASILRASDLSLSEPWDRVLARAGELREAGFSYLVAGWPSEGRGRLEAFVERVMPEVAAL